jgi:hypothetical protein
MSIPGVFALIYVPSKLIVHGNATASANNIAASAGLQTDPTMKFAGPLCVRRRFRLTLAFRHHSELNAEGVQDRVDGFKTWARACRQGFVEALPA